MECQEVGFVNTVATLLTKQLEQKMSVTLKSGKLTPQGN